jgi:hypothetical protein
MDRYSEKVGNYQIQNTVWVDEHTLNIVLPQDLPYGIFDVWVTNPGGQKAVLPGALDLGGFTFVPMVVR